jgi:CotH kinase protein/Concanavalin A-like lectin/glucanases superfamily
MVTATTRPLVSACLLLVAASLIAACGSDPPATPGPVAGRGGTGGGSGGAPADAAANAPVDAPAPPPPDATPADTFVATPSNLPVLIFELPGIPIETVGELKVPGNLKIIEGQGMPPGALQKIGLALHRTVASPGSIAFELRDAADQPRKDGLLGLPHQGDWIAQACVSDRPCLRNMLGFAIGGQLAPSAPKARLVEIYYNDEYKGLFQLIAPATRDQGRVDVPDPAATGPGEALTGGYVLRREGTGLSLPTAMPLLDFLSMATAPGMYPHQLIYSYVFPRPDAITPAQKAYIDGHMAAFETAMKGPDFANPTTGYRSWIDVASWSDFFILAEVSHNIDGYWKNIVLTKQRDTIAARGKLSMTPLWDFSIAFGKPESRSGWRSDKLSFDAANSAITSSYIPGGECPAPEWLPRGAPLCGANCCLPTTMCQLPAKCWNMPFRPFWWDLIQADPTFRNETRCRYRDLRKAGGALDMARLDAFINDWKAQLSAGAYTRHLERSPALRNFAFPFDPYRMDPRTAPDPMSTPQAFLDKEVKWFRDWVDARLKWLDDNLPGVCASVNETPRDGGAGDSGGAVNEPVDLARGLVGYWKLDETAGPMARDTSTAMNHGTLMNFRPADFVVGRTGNGLTFDPLVVPVVVVANAPSLNPTTGLSIAAFIRANDWTGNRRIVQKGDTDNQYRLTAESGVLKLHLAGVTNGTLEAVLPATGGFHHVAGTFDGKSMRIYVDGAVVAEEKAPIGSIAVSPSNLHIGLKRVGAPNVDAFSGVLDEVVLYDRGLNAAEVARLATGAPPL